MATRPAPSPTDVEKRTIRKLRTRIIPFVFVLFVIAVLDRNNIGFAALTMNRELAITSQQYGLVAGIFFFGYFIFEIPSNLMLHKTGARVWIARILISWGLVAILTGFAQTALHLYVLRFLLGVAEAGYFPGIMLYLTYWFRQRDLAHSVAWFLTANAVANIVGAPLSGIILDHAHWHGISSWRWLLILQGAPAIVGGVCTYFLLSNRPAEAPFLTTAEKDWITAELAREEQQKLERRQFTVVEALTDGRVWHMTAIYFTAMVSMWAMTFWMPQLVKAISSRYSNTTVGALVMIPYLLALVIMTTVGRSSDRSFERRYHGAIPLVVAAVSIVVLSSAPIGSVFFSVPLWCLVASGIYSFWGPFWSLPSEFLTGFSAAAGIALINCIGNLGGFVGPYAMGAISRQTGSFRRGLVFAGASLVVSAMLLIALPKRTEQHVADGAAAELLGAGVMPTADTD